MCEDTQKKDNIYEMISKQIIVKHFPAVSSDGAILENVSILQQKTIIINTELFKGVIQ